MDPNFNIRDVIELLLDLRRVSDPRIKLSPQEFQIVGVWEEFWFRQVIEEG